MEHRWCGSRVQISVDAALSSVRENGFVIPGKITDISPDGMFIETDLKHLNNGASVEIQFHAKGKPEGELYQVLGIVRHTYGRGIGVIIHADDEATKRAIRVLCNKDNAH